MHNSVTRFTFFSGLLLNIHIMTRFARASGSKASNKHVPEEATPWSEMRQQMELRKHEIKEMKEKQMFMETRKRNYEEFLNEQDEPKEIQWADFTESLNIAKEPYEQNSGNQGYAKKSYKKHKISHSNGELIQNVHVSKDISSNNTSFEAIEHTAGENEIKDINEKKIKKGLKKKKLKAIASHDITTSDELSPVTKLKKQKGKKQKGTENQTKHYKDISIEQNVSKENEQEAFMKSHTVLKRPDKEESTNQSDKTKKKNKKRKIMQPSIKSEQETNDVNSKGQVVEQTDVKQLVYKNKSKEYSKKNERKNHLKMKLANTNVANDKLRSNVAVKKIKQKNFQVNKKSSKYDRRCMSIFVGGVEIQIGYYDGFPVKKDDFERLTTLKKQMITKGIPKSEIDVTMKLERR